MGCDICWITYRDTGSALLEVRPKENLFPYRCYSVFAVLGCDYGGLGILPGPVHDGVPCETLGNLLPRYNGFGLDMPIGWGVRWALVNELINMNLDANFVNNALICYHERSIVEGFVSRLTVAKAECGITHLVYGFNN